MTTPTQLKRALAFPVFALAVVLMIPMLIVLVPIGFAAPTWFIEAFEWWWERTFRA